jgi:hypothetical protein
MRKKVGVSDSFKGSLSSLDICKIALERVPGFSRNARSSHSRLMW